MLSVADMEWRCAILHWARQRHWSKQLTIEPLAAVRGQKRLQSHAVDLVLDIVAGSFDGLERANDRKKLADAAQPLYASLNAQQKSRFAGCCLAATVSATAAGWNECRTKRFTAAGIAARPWRSPKNGLSAPPAGAISLRSISKLTNIDQRVGWREAHAGSTADRCGCYPRLRVPRSRLDGEVNHAPIRTSFGLVPLSESWEVRPRRFQRLCIRISAMRWLSKCKPSGRNRAGRWGPDKFDGPGRLAARRTACTDLRREAYRHLLSLSDCQPARPGPWQVGDFISFLKSLEQ